MDLETLSNSQLRTLIQRAETLLDARHRKAKQEKLVLSLTPISLKQIDKDGGYLGLFTSRSFRRRMKGGFFESARGGIYAKTVTGKLWHFDTFRRKWERV